VRKKTPVLDFAGRLTPMTMFFGNIGSAVLWSHA
jgi:hypothetical protein